MNDTLWFVRSQNSTLALYLPISYSFLPPNRVGYGGLRRATAGYGGLRRATVGCDGLWLQNSLALKKLLNVLSSKGLKSLK